jgi:cellulose synthase/poly-beta-1,6-N-acetylglucosamine synthase-like glycosyltransferase
MGGLYRKKAIDEIEYFSNKNLHAYEEAELGLRLASRNWTLKRIDTPGIKHYGYATTSFGVFQKRWKTRYVKGSGDFLRSSIGKSYFFKTAWHLKIYIFLAFWWFLIIASAIFAIIQKNAYFIKIIGIITAIMLVLFFLKKRNIKEFSFSLVSWHYSTIGLIWGLFSTQNKPAEKIDSKVLK